MSGFGMGPVLAATVTVANLNAAIKRYSDVVGYVPDAAGVVSTAQAASWGAPAMVGRAWQMMRPESREPGWIRLVEGTRPTAYRPLGHFGWGAIEILLRNTDDMHARMKDTEFAIIGEPHPLKSSPDIKAMQVLGPDGEALYLPTCPRVRARCTNCRSRKAISTAFLLWFLRSRTSPPRTPTLRRASVSPKPANAPAA